MNKSLLYTHRKFSFLPHTLCLGSSWQVNLNPMPAKSSGTHTKTTCYAIAFHLRTSQHGPVSPYSTPTPLRAMKRKYNIPDLESAQSPQRKSKQGFQPQTSSGLWYRTSQPGPQALQVPSTCSPNYLLMLCLLPRALSPSSLHHPSGTTSSAQGSSPRSQQQAQWLLAPGCPVTGFCALVWGGPNQLPVRQELPSLFLPASLRSKGPHIEL